MRIAFWDTETDGLLKQLTKMHCLGIVWDDGEVLSTADQPGYVPLAAGVAGWWQLAAEQ